MNFKFLHSERFWAMVIAAFSVYLKTKGWIGEPEMMLIATITSGFAVIRTIDRLSDKSIESAKITSGISPEEAKDIPPIN